MINKNKIINWIYEHVNNIHIKVDYLSKTLLISRDIVEIILNELKDINKVLSKVSRIDCPKENCGIIDINGMLPVSVFCGYCNQNHSVEDCNVLKVYRVIDRDKLKLLYDTINYYNTEDTSKDLSD